MKPKKTKQKKLIKKISVLHKQILGLEKLKTDVKYYEKELEKYSDDFEEKLANRTTTERIINKQLRNEIFQRKFLEEALQVTATRYRSLFETTREGVLILDGNTGQILDVNPALVEMTGYSRAQLLEKKLWDLGAFRDVAAAKNILSDLQTKKYVRYENLPLVTKNGQVLEVEILSNSYKIKDKKLVQCNIRDIGERKRIERLREAVIRTVAHELRSPLSIIKEGVSVILDRIAGNLTKKQEEVLNLVNDTIDRLVRVSNNLLDISKLETGNIELNKEFVNLTGLIKEAVLLFELKAKNKGLDLEAGLPEKEVNVYIDKDKIFQVLTNLIGNAVKFTQNGSVKVSVAEEEKYVEVAVTDTGRGIDKDDLPNLFTEFKQFGIILKGLEKGSGLGLCISRNIVELHDGKMRLESKLGKGTKFIFTLPKGFPAVSKKT